MVPGHARSTVQGFPAVQKLTIVVHDQQCLLLSGFYSHLFSWWKYKRCGNYGWYSGQVLNCPPTNHHQGDPTLGSLQIHMTGVRQTQGVEKVAPDPISSVWASRPKQVV